MREILIWKWIFIFFLSMELAPPIEMQMPVVRQAPPLVVTLASSTTTRTNRQAVPDPVTRPRTTTRKPVLRTPSTYKIRPNLAVAQRVTTTEPPTTETPTTTSTTASPTTTIPVPTPTPRPEVSDIPGKVNDSQVMLDNSNATALGVQMVCSELEMLDSDIPVLQEEFERLKRTCVLTLTKALSHHHLMRNAYEKVISAGAAWNTVKSDASETLFNAHYDSLCKLYKDTEDLYQYAITTAARIAAAKQYLFDSELENLIPSNEHIKYLMHMFDHGRTYRAHKEDEEYFLNMEITNKYPQNDKVRLPKEVEQMINQGKLKCTNKTLPGPAKCNDVQALHDGYLMYTVNPEGIHTLSIGPGCDTHGSIPPGPQYDHELYEAGSPEDYDRIHLCWSDTENPHKCTGIFSFDRAGWCRIVVGIEHVKRRDRQCKLLTKKIKENEFELRIQAPGRERVLYRIGKDEFQTTFEKEIVMVAKIKDPKTNFYYRCGKNLDFKKVENRSKISCRSQKHWLWAWTCNKALATGVTILAVDIGLFLLFKISMVYKIMCYLLSWAVHAFVIMKTIRWADDDYFAYMTLKKDKKRCPACDSPVNNFANHWTVAHNESNKNPIKSATRKIMVSDYSCFFLNVLLGCVYIGLIFASLYYLTAIPGVNGETKIKMGDKKIHKSIVENIGRMYNFTGTRFIDGYHTYKVNNFIDESRVDTIDTIVDNRKCKGEICSGTVSADMTININPGFVSGFKLQVGSEQFFIGIRATTTKVLYQAEFLYRDCDNELIANSGDTCTADCNECLKAINSEGLTVAKHDTSSWGCNDWACWSIDQGCTCGSCYHKPTGNCFDVLKLHKSESLVEICIEIGNIGQCMTIKKGQPATGDLLKAIFLTDPVVRDKQIVAQHLQSLYEGSINDLGEANDKFGALQFMTSAKMNCYRDVEYEHHCIFGKHRWLTFTKCCKDTHYMKDTLTATTDLVLAPEDVHKTDKRVVIQNGVDLGTARIVLKLPDFPLMEVQNDLKVLNISISEFAGCPVCKEGATAKLTIVSENAGWVPIESNCILNTKKIVIYKGSNIVPILFKSWMVQSHLEITINGVSANSTFNLTDQREGLIDETHNPVPSSRSETNECGNIFCYVKIWWNNQHWSYIATGVTVICLFAGILALNILVK